MASEVKKTWTLGDGQEALPGGPLVISFAEHARKMLERPVQYVVVVVKVKEDDVGNQGIGRRDMARLAEVGGPAPAVGRARQGSDEPGVNLRVPRLLGAGKPGHKRPEIDGAMDYVNCRVMNDYKHGERTHRDEPEADMEELAKHIDAPQHTTVEKTAKAPHDSYEANHGADGGCVQNHPPEKHST